MKILIVDEDKSIAELTKEYLCVGGFDCDIVSDGESALELALREEYAMVILETALSKHDGYTVCKELRKSKTIPIVFLSSAHEEIDIVRGFGSGADDYITKPFSPGEMVARIKAHINRYESLTARFNKKTSGLIQVRNLTIDKDARRVYLNGTEISMPVKEYELLVFFAENPNIVFSKERLFDRLWGIDAMSDISTVTVHIQRIRDKIELSDNKFIETVWGAGYRFKT